MRRRREPEPDELAERKAEVDRLLDDARRRQRSQIQNAQKQAWWAEAVSRLEAIAASDDPDLEAAARAWRFGHHVLVDQPSAAARPMRPDVSGRRRV